MDALKSKWIAAWTWKKFTTVLLVILLTPAILTLVIASFSGLAAQPRHEIFDPSLGVALTVGFWTSVISGLLGGLLLGLRLGTASPWRILLSLFSIAIFFVVSIALCLCGCGLGDSLRR